MILIKTNTKMVLMGDLAIKQYFPDFDKENLIEEYLIWEYIFWDMFNLFNKNKEIYTKNKVLSDRYYKTDKKIMDIDDIYTYLIYKTEEPIYDTIFLKKKDCKLNLDLLEKLCDYGNKTNKISIF